MAKLWGRKNFEVTLYRLRSCEMKKLNPLGILTKSKYVPVKLPLECQSLLGLPADIKKKSKKLCSSMKKGALFDLLDKKIVRKRDEPLKEKILRIV